jgi:hypothetical protein
MNKYRIYIDETGNSDLKSSNNNNHRFLSLTGVIIRLDYVDNFLHDDTENLKKRFFNYHTDDPIIFHRKDMVNCRNDFAELKDNRIKVQFGIYSNNRVD